VAAGADSAGADSVAGAAGAGAGVEVDADGVGSAAGAGAGVGAGAAFFGYSVSSIRILKETAATFETMTTRKSFSLILRESTFAVSLKIFPTSSALSANDEIEGRRLTRVDELLVLHWESL